MNKFMVFDIIEHLAIFTVFMFIIILTFGALAMTAYACGMVFMFAMLIIIGIIVTVGLAIVTIINIKFDIEDYEGWNMPSFFFTLNTYS